MNPNYHANRSDAQQGDSSLEKRSQESTPANRTEGTNEQPVEGKTPVTGEQAGQVQKLEAQHVQHPPAAVPGAESRSTKIPPAENQRVQLYRMILPQSERAKVQKYAPQVERNVLVPRVSNNQPGDKGAGTKRKK